MAAQFSSTGISHNSLLPHIPSILLSTVNSSPRPGIAPQSLNSSSQWLLLSGELHPCLGYVKLWQGLSDSQTFRLPQISHFTLCLKFFSSDSDNCPDVGIRPLLQFPHPRRQSSPTNSCFSPYFLHSTEFCMALSFSLVRYSCLLLAGVLHALLCLKVYS